MSRESSTQADEIKRQIGAQVDFYFADTNYRRDTYLRSLEQDGWVPIAQLLNFNKIKAITQDVDAIYSAVQGSHVVEVHPTEPKIKKKCFQISRDEADRRTVYVEGFPMNADHDSLRAEFSAVGDVTLVSMPRHAKTRKFKGFAFVEFATVADASKACQAYSQADGWLVVTKIEWIRTRKRYGRIREKCGRVAQRTGQQVPEPLKRSAETAADVERDASKVTNEEIDFIANDQQTKESKEDGAPMKKRKKKRRDKGKSTEAA